MINELKLILDMVGDLTGIALWVLLGFIIFKLVIYLSTTGAIVYLVKLGITKLHDYLVNGPLAGTQGIDFVDEKAKATFHKAINRVPRHGCGFWHISHSQWLNEAIVEKLEREDKSKEY